MATANTSTLTVNIDPGLKQSLHTAANREYRSIAKMVDVQILDYCGSNKIMVQMRVGLIPEENHKFQPTKQ